MEINKKRLTILRTTPEMKKAIIIVLAITASATTALYTLAAPVLRYAEGWTTFYWDGHHVAEVLAGSGIPELMRAFILQFFAVPATGVALMTALLLMSSIVIMSAVWFMRKRLSSIYLSLVPILALASSSLAFVSPNGLEALTSRFSSASAGGERFVELTNMSRDSDWQGMLASCHDIGSISNLLTLNLLNMAHAECGSLGDILHEEPCHDVRAIFVNDIQTPDVAALLSDVYYSMGHIAQAQRYAFELNEKKGNLSPRLLKRLVQTNIIYGQYAVAEKYIRWLKKTIFYKEWAMAQERLIHDEAAVEKDKEYAMKRKCLIADNRFSGIKGFDDDLLRVARQTRGSRQCFTTLQYLGSLYLLARYDKRFINLCEEFPEYKLTEQKYFGEAYKRLKGTVTQPLP